VVTDHVHDEACEVAHGDRPAPQTGPRTLIAVFESPVAEFILRLGLDLGYRTVLVEPDPVRLSGRPRAHGDAVVNSLEAARPDDNTDVVVTDHDRPELGGVLRDALKGSTRWIGVMGSPRHAGPHVAALHELGVPDDEIARVHRPIGLNIGSRTPAEIAVATLAGLIADRNGRAGGFVWRDPGA
jgi:xanthine/CO dehydrogenase XdhC/CoxF family maturation factor